MPVLNFHSCEELRPSLHGASRVLFALFVSLFDGLRATAGSVLLVLTVRRSTGCGLIIVPRKKFDSHEDERAPIRPRSAKGSLQLAPPPAVGIADLAAWQRRLRNRLVIGEYPGDHIAIIAEANPEFCNSIRILNFDPTAAVRNRSLS
tara:strand:- start:276 stop:719 length:444 start_codon:yes stop_codon:yes gene_type:complete